MTGSLFICLNTDCCSFFSSLFIMCAGSGPKAGANLISLGLLGCMCALIKGVGQLLYTAQWCSRAVVLPGWLESGSVCAACMSTPVLPFQGSATE